MTTIFSYAWTVKFMKSDNELGVVFFFFSFATDKKIKRKQKLIKPTPKSFFALTDWVKAIFLFSFMTCDCSSSLVCHFLLFIRRKFPQRSVFASQLHLMNHWTRAREEKNNKLIVAADEGVDSFPAWFDNDCDECTDTQTRFIFW